mgnify:CR=1 FL=1
MIISVQTKWYWILKEMNFQILTNFDNFINEITWNTEIKRFILLTSEALLYLLAFKTKNKLSLASIIESIVGFGNPVTFQNILDEFDDV